MNLYETDFLNKMVTVLKEAFKFKKYKAMSPALAVFTGILMIPVVLISFVMVAILSVLSFAFAVCYMPIKYLHHTVNTEGQNVKHATQAVIYLISWPIVFFFYVLMSLLVLLIFPAYAAFSFFTYVWTLGGFKFHLFANQSDDISIEVNGKYNALPVVFVVVGAILLVFIPIIHSIIHYFELYANYMEKFFFKSFFGQGGIYSDYVSVHTLFAILYTLIGFAPNPKKKVVEEVEASEEL